jgi:hypothetical protein
MSQTTPTIADIKEYEKESQAEAKRCDILCNVKICVMVQDEIDEYMRKAREDAWTVYHAKEYEKNAQAMARKHNLPIPTLSDVEIHIKAQEEIGHIMTVARDDIFNVDMAIHCEKKAQTVARTYNLPIPKIPDIEIRMKATWQIQDCMMRACQYAVTVDGAREYEKEAQAMAKKYNISTPKFSDIDIDIIKQRENAKE